MLNKKIITDYFMFSLTQLPLVLLPAGCNSKKQHRRKLPRSPRRTPIEQGSWPIASITKKNKYICDNYMIPKAHCNRLFKNEYVHDTKLFVPNIHDCDIRIIGIPTYAIGSIVLDP